MITIRWPDHFPVRVLEWFLASIMLTYSPVFLFGTGLFDRPFFQPMQNIWPQYLWGWMFLIMSLIHLSALYVNGTRRKSPHVRATCSGLSAIIWLQMDFGMFLSDKPNFGMVLYTWFVIASIYNAIRASMDARISDDRAKGGIVENGTR